MDIVAIAVCLFVWIFLLELSYQATERGSKRFWAFLAMVTMITVALQVFSDAGITYGQTTITVGLAVTFVLFIFILIPALRIYSVE